MARILEIKIPQQENFLAFMVWHFFCHATSRKCNWCYCFYRHHCSCLQAFHPCNRHKKDSSSIWCFIAMCQGATGAKNAFSIFLHDSWFQGLLSKPEFFSINLPTYKLFVQDLMLWKFKRRKFIRKENKLGCFIFNKNFTKP